MRPMLALIVVAGCTAAVPFDDPCACVIIPVANGAVSLSLGGRAIAFDGPTDGSRSETTAIQGTVWTTATFGEANAIALSPLTQGVWVEARWNASDSFDMAAPAAITRIEVDTLSFADVGFEDDMTYVLGPGGGTVTLREIVPDGAAWRVRGAFRAEVCPETPATGACLAAAGNFAFTTSTLPENGNAQALVPAG